MIKVPLSQSWDEYVQAVLPKECSSIQMRETKNSFYAGAWIALQNLKEASQTENEVEAIAYLASLEKECMDHCAAYAESHGLDMKTVLDGALQ